MSWGRLGIRLGTPAHVWKVPGLGLSLAQKPHHLACLLERDCVNWGSLEASPRRPGRSVCVSRTIQQREFLYLQAGEPACAVDGPLEWRVQCSRGQKEVHGDIPLNWQSCGNNHHLHVCFPTNSCKPTFVHPCIFYSCPWNEWVGALWIRQQTNKNVKSNEGSCTPVHMGHHLRKVWKYVKQPMTLGTHMT